MYASLSFFYLLLLCGSDSTYLSFKTNSFSLISCAWYKFHKETNMGISKTNNHGHVYRFVQGYSQQLFSARWHLIKILYISPFFTKITTFFTNSMKLNIFELLSAGLQCLICCLVVGSKSEWWALPPGTARHRPLQVEP